MSDSEAWYSPEGLCFSCTGCGNCCRGPESGYVFVTLEEIETLAARLGISTEDFGAKYLRRVAGGQVSLIEKQNLDCVFWTEGKGCEVYEDRPTQCRTFPFWPEVIESEEAWEVEAESCPGMGSGKRYLPAAIESLAEGEGGTPDGPNRGSRRKKGKR